MSDLNEAAATASSAVESVVGKWSISTDQENFSGLFGTVEDAVAEARTYGRQCWVGQCVSPEPPENLFDESSVQNWLEMCVYEHDDYSHEWADGAVAANRTQQAELASEIRPIIAAWLDRNGLRPTHYNIDPASVREVNP